MSKIYGISGVILYRVQSFLSPRTDLNFRHLSSCDTIKAVRTPSNKLCWNTEVGPAVQGEHNASKNLSLIETVHSPCRTGSNSSCWLCMLDRVTLPSCKMLIGSILGGQKQQNRVKPRLRTVLLVLATGHFFLMLQGLWNHVAHLARGKFFYKIAEKMLHSWQRLGDTWPHVKTPSTSASEQLWRCQVASRSRKLYLQPRP